MHCSLCWLNTTEHWVLELDAELKDCEYGNHDSHGRVKVKEMSFIIS